MHHGSYQGNSIGFLKEKFGVHTVSLPSISMVLANISFSENMMMLFFKLFNDTRREIYVLLNSVQELIEVEA